ncbi:hypothetical protein VTJ83DRAFT_7067 [Remersonia thermophila]|uniref:BZIP domain-containing protein n=1 Tax=Remersonia thermophila TaxID=72144 RepID=A0ABR4D4S4_9PEZI
MLSEPCQFRVHKFSSKPPGHNAARQRENQRRHRARVKGRLAELEAQLESTQARLADALRQIEALTADVHRLRHALHSTQAKAKSEERIRPAQLDAAGRGSPRSETDADPDDQRGSGGSHAAHGSRPLPEMPAPSAPSPSGLDEAPPGPCTGNPPSRSVTITSSNVASSIKSNSSSNIDDPDDDCPFLPPPKPGESTMPCREAFALLQDRVLSITGPELDLSAAAEWLRPGFRRAVVPGSGCRVQTHVLFAFVDHVTGT